MLRGKPTVPGMSRPSLGLSLHRIGSTLDQSLHACRRVMALTPTLLDRQVAIWRGDRRYLSCIVLMDRGCRTGLDSP